MARTASRRPLPRRIPAVFPCLAALFAVASSSAAHVRGQEAPAPAKQDAPVPVPAKGEAAPPEKKPLHVKKCTVPGADPTGELFLAAVGKDGRRSEFGPLAADTAFEIWLEGQPPVKVTTQEPDPANPGQTIAVEHVKVAVAPVSIAEIDGCIATARAIGAVGNEGMFVNALLAGVLEQRAAVLYYHDVLPGMKERLQRAVEKIDKGVPFEKVIKQNSEDDQGKMRGGYFGDNVRGENIGRYPFEQIVFGLEPGDVVGPVFDKFMAYVMLCDRHWRVDEKHRDEQVLTRVVCSRYAVNLMNSKDTAKLLTSVRVRSDKERFVRVLPPGAQVPPPKQFGPDDIAPVGKPEQPLKFRSPVDAIDGKARTDH
jgi:hypothetical protein